MRRVKTPAERAAEALGVAERRVKRLQDKRVVLKDALDALEHELALAQALRDYAALNPAREPSEEDES